MSLHECQHHLDAAAQASSLGASVPIVEPASIFQQYQTMGDAALAGGVLAVTIWFFFLQSPVLFRLMGRKAFVPVMMKLTQLYFDCLLPATAAVAALALMGQSDGYLQQKIAQPHVFFAILALAFAAVNRQVVVPMALAAGRRSAKERAAHDTKEVIDFVSQGGSKTETKTLHRTVVALVLLMAASMTAHLAMLP